MKKQTEKEIDFTNVSSTELLEYISWKNDFPNEAEKAFIEFCSRFDKIMIRKAEVYSSRYNYSEIIALEIAHCTFNRVWRYAKSFNLKKINSNTHEKGIIKWLTRILYTQLVILKDKNSCIEPNEDEDLSIIENLDDLTDFTSSENLEAKRELRMRLEILEGAFKGISLKHKIIYLTYKAYKQQGKNIPRSVSKKLREQLDLTQNSVRVYKNEAYSHVDNYIKQLNGN